MYPLDASTDAVTSTAITPDFTLTQVDVDTLFQFASSMLVVQIFILAALVLVVGLLFGLALTKSWNV